MRILRLLRLVLIVGCIVYFVWFWPLRNPHPPVQPARGTLVIRDVRIYPSPTEPAIEHGTVVVRDGVITSLGADAVIPPDAQVLTCADCSITAGFWNAHVHFTELKWDLAAWKPAATLDAQLADMLTSRGFTTVVDAGSDPRITLSLRRRIETGGLKGPKIYTAAAGICPPHGIPYYLKDSIPAYVIWFMPQPATPEEAARGEEANIARGSDLLKLFTGSYVARGKVLPMPEPIAKAAVEVAHRHGQLVYSHPSDFAGTKVAVDSGVDVLAHAPDSPEGIDAAFLHRIVDQHMAMIPTLKMFGTTVTPKPQYLLPIYAEVREIHEFGGQLMFGTDVGYMTDYTTADEFHALAQCGLNTRDILAMLTTAPSQRFGVANRTGTIAIGKQADLVVLDGDPGRSIDAFTQVHFTIRNGRVIYSK